jgi:hypothetical protein
MTYFNKLVNKYPRHWTETVAMICVLWSRSLHRYCRMSCEFSNKCFGGLRACRAVAVRVTRCYHHARCDVLTTNVFQRFHHGENKSVGPFRACNIQSFRTLRLKGSLCGHPMENQWLFATVVCSIWLEPSSSFKSSSDFGAGAFRLCRVFIWQSLFTIARVYHFVRFEPPAYENGGGTGR